MKIVICGAGQVGQGIAERLSRERNNVALIDSSESVLQDAADRLDVKTIHGHASHPDVLARAGAADADMLIAVTTSDEVNMMACEIGHGLFNVPMKIARVRAQAYLAPEWSDLFGRDHVPIDVVISPEMEVSEAVLRQIATPGAVETVGFCGGAVMVLAVACEENCPVVDTPLKQLTELFPDLDATIVGVQRGKQVMVPRSDDMLVAGDVAFVVAATERVRRTLSLFGHDEPLPSRVVIAGGGNVGLQVAQQIEQRFPAIRAKLIEISRERALDAAEALDRTVVLHGSALDQALQREADIDSADLMISLSNDDQVNVLSAMMAKRLGAKRSLCLINNRSYQDFTSGLGIDAYVNPRTVTVSRVLQHVRRGRIRAVYSLMDGEAEIIEAEALSTSSLVGRPLREIDFADGVRVGAVLRQGRTMFPRGDTVIMAGDRVVLFAKREYLKTIEQMFRVSLEFF